MVVSEPEPTIETPAEAGSKVTTRPSPAAVVTAKAEAADNAKVALELAEPVIAHEPLATAKTGLRDEPLAVAAMDIEALAAAGTGLIAMALAVAVTESAALPATST